MSELSFGRIPTGAARISLRIIAWRMLERDCNMETALCASLWGVRSRLVERWIWVSSMLDEPMSELGSFLDWRLGSEDRFEEFGDATSLRRLGEDDWVWVGRCEGLGCGRACGDRRGALWTGIAGSVGWTNTGGACVAGPTGDALGATGDMVGVEGDEVDPARFSRNARSCSTRSRRMFSMRCLRRSSALGALDCETLVVESTRPVRSASCFWRVTSSIAWRFWRCSLAF